MALAFLLNQKYGDLAIAEAKAAAFDWKWWEHKEKAEDSTLLLESRAKPAHLALTRQITKLLASCAVGNVRSTLSALDWKFLQGKRYKVVLTKQVARKENERELASVIWHSLKEPRVDLEHPEVIVDIILTSKNAHIGIRQWQNTEEFEDRRGHLRPQMHPSSMHPLLSRALVNISCATSIHDPCCGSGGVLIEAGLAGRKISGGDTDPAMIARAKTNCLALGLHPELRIADATAWIPRTGAIIADLPYGKNTSPVALQPLLEGILLRASQSTSRAIIGLPHAMPMPWKVRAHFESYVHKSMTKHFYVVEKE